VAAWGQGIGHYFHLQLIDSLWDEVVLALSRRFLASWEAGEQNINSGFKSMIMSDLMWCLTQSWN
jgi:hypothetical protein